MKRYYLFVESDGSWIPCNTDPFVSAAAALAGAEVLGLSVFRIETL